MQSIAQFPTDEIAPPAHQRTSVSRYGLPNGQVVTAIVGPPGRKWLNLAYIDCPVRLCRVPLTDRRYMSDMDYPITDACRKMLDAGKRLGITKGAKTFLKAHSYPEQFQTVTFGGSKSPFSLGVSQNTESAPTTTKGGANVTRLCASCRREFQARAHTKTTFCSRACKQKAYRRRVSS